MGKPSKKSATKVEAAPPASTTKPLKKGKREAEDDLDIKVHPKPKKHKKDLIPEKKVEEKAPSKEISATKKPDSKNASLKANTESSSESSSDEETIPEKKQPATVEKAKEESENETSSSDEESVPEKKQPDTQKAKAESSSEDESSSSDEESEPVKKEPVVGNAKAESSSSEDEDESSSEDEESSPVKKQQTVVENAKADSSSSEEDSSSDEEEPAPTKKNPVIAKQVSKDSSSEEESEDEKKPEAVKKPVDSSSEEEESSSDEESDDEEKPPLKKAKVSSTESKTSEEKSSSDESSEESDEESEDEKVTPKKKVDDVKMEDVEQKSNVKQPKTPSTGSKTLFAGNLSFRVDKSDVENFFKDVGEVVDIRFTMNEDGSSKGYGHVEFASGEAAEKAMELNGKQLLGRSIRLDPAKERGQFSTPRSSNAGKGSQFGTLCVKKLRYSTLGEEDLRRALRDHFETCGVVTRIAIPTDRETGASKGIAYIDFKDGFEKAMEQSGTEIGGCRIVVEQARPRGVKPGEDSGDRFSRPGNNPGRFSRPGNNPGRFSCPGNNPGRFSRGRDNNTNGRTSTNRKPSVIASSQGKKTVFNDDE